jgi:hypothetical protein
MSIDWREVDRWLAGEAWVGSQIDRHVMELCDRIGPRWGGSEGDHRAAEYISGQMRSFGLANVRTEEFTIHTWEPGHAEARVADGGPEIKVLPFNRTPSVNVTAPLVDAGFGTPREIEAVSTLRARSQPAGGGGHRQTGASRGGLNGAIALMTMASEPFSPLISVADRLKLLSKAGAAACICVDRKAGWRVEYHSASDWRDPGLDEHPLPTVATPREGGAMLRRLAAEGKSLSLVVEGRFYDSTACNTVADLQGSRWPDEHILLAGHHDTVHGTAGGNDNASGTVGILETARVFGSFVRESGVRPGRTIRFCTWSGEEQKLQGSAEFVRRHYAGPEFNWPQGYGSGRLRSGPETPPRFALNLDELSTGSVKGVVLNFPHSRGFIQDQLDTLGEGLKCHVLEYLDPWSDHFPFALAAIDSGFLWRWRFVGKHLDSDYHHEPGDTADKINVRELKEYVGFLARFLLRLSYIPPEDWPSGPETPASVQARLKAERPFVQRTM